MAAPRLSKAVSTGIWIGLATLAIWALYLGWPESFVLPYVAALLVTAMAGLYILLATAYDSYRNPRRGARIKPIRGFDIAVGILLAGPAIWGLHPFFPAL